MHYGKKGVEAKKVNKAKKCKLNESRGKIINFAEIGGIYKFCGN